MKQPAKDTGLSEADEIEAMLPWLVTGKLGRDEEMRVSRYLETHPEAAAHVALAREEFEGAVATNEAIRPPSAANLDRLMATIAETPQTRAFAVPSPAGIWDKFAQFVGGFSPTTLGIAGAAAAIAIVAQAATIGVLLSKDAPGPAYQTASGGNPASTAAGVEALVMLQPGVAAGTLTAALSELKVTVVDGPRAGGIYRLRLAGGGDAQAFVDRLKTRTDLFAFIGAAPR